MICEKNKCTGCFACYNICPKNAIEMKEDKLGFIYPSINEKKCVKCGLCKKICPMINKVDFNKPLKCLAARTTIQSILKKSSSGGIATIISQKILEDGGVVYGSAFINNCKVKHIRIDKKEDLKKIQGSKYVHSYIEDSYKKIKNDLTNNKKVLFIGTPCQVAGLKRFLLKPYDNLYTVDIICHGVPSQKFLQEEVIRINKNLDIEKVEFRNKKFPYHFIIQKNDKNLFHEHWKKSPYYYTFMNAYTFRDNCYSCKFAQIKRCSDITIGDFWGINSDCKFYYTRNKGLSVVLPITEKGNTLIKMIENAIEYEQRDINEAVLGNSQLKSPSYRSNFVSLFKEKYLETNDFYKTYRKMFVKNHYREKFKSLIFYYEFIKIGVKIKKRIIKNK